MNWGGEMNRYEPAKKKTMYFIGVTTGKSSIMKVFPRWMEQLGVDAEIRGIDFPPHAEVQRYREAVSFIKGDPNSLGALVTSHKIDCYRACEDLFDGIGSYARLLGEASSISKRGGELWAHAKDPETSGLAYEAFVPEGHFRGSEAEVLILGAGGSSLALTLYLINKAKGSDDVPERIVVTNRSERRLEEMKEIHRRLGLPFSVAYHLCPTPADNDRVVGRLPAGSVVVNATGVGKDIPGSPVTDAVRFPKGGYVWEFNYRGDLEFLRQAEVQRKERDLKVTDGWTYFVHGWTRVIAEVFHLEIPTSGPEFEQLGSIARAAR